MSKFRGALVAVATVTMSLAGVAGTANATPSQVDPVTQLVAAGVPLDVARQVDGLQPAAATDEVAIGHPGMEHSFPGTEVDAVLDHEHGTTTVIQRWLTAGVPSQLSVGWVNLSTGRAGVSGLPEERPSRDPLYANYPDRAGTIATGNGNIALVVWGRLPAWTGLLPLAPEYFGIYTPAVKVVTV